MIRQRGIVATAALLGLLGCNDPADPTGRSEALEVYVGEYFQADYVSVTLDGQPLFSGVVTTQSFSAPAATVYTSSAMGRHRIAVNVGGLSANQEFTVNAPTYVVISRVDRDGPPSVTILHQRPMWD